MPLLLNWIYLKIESRLIDAHHWINYSFDSFADLTFSRSLSIWLLDRVTFAESLENSNRELSWTIDDCNRPFN